VVSLNYATEQPPGPVAGFGNVYVAQNDTLIAIDAEQGVYTWNASVAYPISMSAVLNNVLDGVVSIPYTAGQGSAIMVRGFNAKTGAVLWDTNGAITPSTYSYLSGFFASGEFVNVFQAAQEAAPYNFAINASSGVVVWTGPSADASADAEAEWLFTVSSNPNVQLNSSLVGTEQGSGYMDYSVTIPNSLVQCNSMLGHVSQSATAGTTRRLVVSGCTWNDQSQSPTQTSLIWGFYLPLRQSMTVSQCTDLKCSEGCQDVTYQERCTPQQWDSAATAYSVWEMRTCTASEMDIIQVEGTYGGASLVSLKSQFVNQCVIDGATRRSSMVTKCG
jgi:hypothetical protein